jgi:hypothetical protein
MVQREVAIHVVVSENIEHPVAAIFSRGKAMLPIPSTGRQIYR